MTISHEVASFDDEATKGHVGELVPSTVKETINEQPDEEADQLVNADRYERTNERQAYRSGPYSRRLVTGAGEVEHSVPKLRGASFTTRIIERYRRRESSIEEAMMETYLAGVSTRRIEHVSEVLWGSSVSKGTVSYLNQRAFAAVEEWRTRPLTCACPYDCVDIPTPRSSCASRCPTGLGLSALQRVDGVVCGAVPGRRRKVPRALDHASGGALLADMCAMLRELARALENEADSMGEGYGCNTWDDSQH